MPRVVVPSNKSCQSITVELLLDTFLGPVSRFAVGDGSICTEMQ